MSPLLTKVATQLVFPLPISLGLALLSLLLLARGRHRAAVVALAPAVALLWLCATPVVSLALRRAIEARHPAVEIAQLPAADAIVVLGTGLDMPTPQRDRAELSGSSDRLLHAARLHRAGKAPWVVPTGGRMPWAPDDSTEAEEMALLLDEWGVPREALLLEAGSRNTRENALSVAALLEQHGLGRVLLVTSALHMPRALACFRAAGVDAVPATTDTRAHEPYSGALDWIPSASFLGETDLAIKELLGFQVYRLRGWL